MTKMARALTRLGLVSSLACPRRALDIT
jgi:hypothetical protein